MAADRCQLGGRLRRCPHPPHETCQYCTRAFCHAHSYVLEGFEAVCSRPPCTAKYDDLQGHYGYVRGVRLRNRDGLCGFGGCDRPHAFECDKCRGHFCLGHLSDQLYPALSALEPATMAVVCPHCWARRTIWSRQ